MTNEEAKIKGDHFREPTKMMDHFSDVTKSDRDSSRSSCFETGGLTWTTRNWLTS